MLTKHCSLLPLAGTSTSLQYAFNAGQRKFLTTSGHQNLLFLNLLSFLKKISIYIVGLSEHVKSGEASANVEDARCCASCYSPLVSVITISRTTLNRIMSTDSGKDAHNVAK